MRLKKLDKQLLSEETVLWEGKNSDKSSICCYYGLIIGLTFFLLLLPISNLKVSGYEFIVIMGISLLVAWLLTRIRGPDFLIKITESYLFIKKSLSNKVFKLKDVQYIEITLGERRESVFKARHSPPRFYSEVKISIKITFPLKEKDKDKVFSFRASFNESARHCERELAKREAKEKRLEFERNIKRLPDIFPELITIKDILQINGRSE